jgi:hypothetical protein
MPAWPRRRLTRRPPADSDVSGRGPSVVQAALQRPDTVVEVFATAAALARYGWLRTAAVRVDEVGPVAADALSETVTPQVWSRAPERRRPWLMSWPARGWWLPGRAA